MVNLNTALETGPSSDILEPEMPELIKQEIEKIKPTEETEKLEENPPVKEVKNDGCHGFCDDEKTLLDLLEVDEQYTPLLALLEQFSPDDDGIQFNRKLQNFETTITSICPDEASLHQAFSTFRAAALLSPVTARKLAAVGASFTRQQRQLLLRGALLNVVMQGIFSKLDVLQRADPSYLINAANLMGDYFAEARLCNGNKVHILASPLLQYMQALLASNDIRAHRSLATQLMQNGRELHSVVPQELDELSISIRLRLLTPPPVNIIWLLLSADLCLNKFLPLPNTLQQFYAAHPGLTTDENYSEVSYGSWKKSLEKDDTTEISLDVSQLSLNSDDNSEPKLIATVETEAAMSSRDEQALTLSKKNCTWQPKTLSERLDLNTWRETVNPKMSQSHLQQNYTTSVPKNQEEKSGKTPPRRHETGDETSATENLKVCLKSEEEKLRRNPIDKSRDRPSNRLNRRTSDQEDKSRDCLSNRLNRRTSDKEDKSRDHPSNRLNRRTSDQEDTSRDRPSNSLNTRTSEQEDKFRDRLSNRLNRRTSDQEDKSRDRPSNRLNRRTSDQEDTSRDRPSNRLNRRTSDQEDNSRKTPPRRHITEVPRNQKYWDHDDRCDKDY